MNAAEGIGRSNQLVRKIAPYIAGEPPEVVLATLTDLTARWVVQHVVADANGIVNARATHEVRQTCLTQFGAALIMLIANGNPPTLDFPSRDDA